MLYPPGPSRVGRPPNAGFLPSKARRQPPRLGRTRRPNSGGLTGPQTSCCWHTLKELLIVDVTLPSSGHCHARPPRWVSEVFRQRHPCYAGRQWGERPHTAGSHHAAGQISRGNHTRRTALSIAAGGPRGLPRRPNRPAGRLGEGDRRTAGFLTSRAREATTTSRETPLTSRAGRPGNWHPAARQYEYQPPSSRPTHIPVEWSAAVEHRGHSKTVTLPCMPSKGGRPPTAGFLLMAHGAKRTSRVTPVTYSGGSTGL
jgi:hypothetical protein